MSGQLVNILTFIFWNFMYIMFTGGIQMISFEPLRIEMVKRKLQWKDIVTGSGVSYYSTRKLKNDGYVELQTLEKICIYLDVQLSDICKITKD